MHDAGDLRHVRERAAAVGHVGEADQRGRGVHGGAHRVRGHAAVQVGVDQAQFRAALGGDPGQHVTIRREVVVVGHDDRPAGAGGQRGPGQLVQVDRGGVTDHHLPGGGAQQVAPEQVPGPAGQADPVAPGPDKPGAPLAAHHVGDPVGRGERQHAERVPVQVDQRRIFQEEALTEAGQGIGRVAVEREGPAGRKAAAHRSTLGCARAGRVERGRPDQCHPETRHRRPMRADGPAAAASNGTGLGRPPPPPRVQTSLKSDLLHRHEFEDLHGEPALSLAQEWVAVGVGTGRLQGVGLDDRVTVLVARGRARSVVADRGAGAEGRARRPPGRIRACPSTRPTPASARRTARGAPPPRPPPPPPPALPRSGMCRR